MYVTNKYIYYIFIDAYSNIYKNKFPKINFTSNCWFVEVNFYVDFSYELKNEFGYLFHMKVCEILKRSKHKSLFQNKLTSCSFFF